MNTTDAIVIGLTIAANAGAAIADVAKADIVMKTSKEVGVSTSWMPIMAGLKSAGAAGLLLGLFGVPIVGTAAAAGLVLYFIAALIAHIRAHVFYNIAFPGFYFALAAGSLALSVSR